MQGTYNRLEIFDRHKFAWNFSYPEPKKVNSTNDPGIFPRLLIVWTHY